MKRARLGTWTTASGNVVEVFLTPQENDVRVLVFEWDCCPLAPADELYYRTHILPAVAQRVREYLELVGPALVIA